MSHIVRSPLEALRQPPVDRVPQLVPASHMMRDVGDTEFSDDDDLNIVFPTASGSAEGSTTTPTVHLESNGGTTPSRSQPQSATTTTVSGTATSFAASKPKTGAKKKKRLPTRKVLHVCFTKYPVIRELADEFNFVMDTVDEELEKFDFNMIWSDTVLPLQKLVRLLNWQRTNHFPSMHLLCRKVHLGLTLGRMRKVFPQHYNFFPRTWSMRSEKQQFARYYAQLTSKKVFILKPNAGCQGRGIILSKDPLNATEELENFVCQEYVLRPLLIENKKFDLRVYCLVTSIRHLSIFVYNDGLVRMCAEDYEKPNDDNMHNSCKHLTNYAVNKHSEHFVFNSDKEGRGDSGNKRDFVWLNRWLQSQGHDPDKFWDRVYHMIIKTIIAAQPQMTHVYNSCFPHSNDGYTCFEVLGFDILVDDRVKPILMEVNHTPSFTCDTPLDHRIKHDMLAETWRIIDVQPTDKMRHQEREKAQFARRMLQQSKASGISSMVPIDSMLSTANVSPHDQLLAGFDNEALLSAEQLAAEHRRKEDSRLKNYRRVYPAKNIEKQALYETILAAAKTASAIPTTASQEQRQQEVRAEREKREQSKQHRTPSTTMAPTTSAPTVVPDSSRRSTQRSAGSSATGSANGGIVPPQPPSLPNSGNVTPTSTSDDVLPSQPFVRSSFLGSQPMSSAGRQVTGGPRLSARSSSSVSQSQNGERPKRTKEEVERQRQKLAEQMERHRRRMVLGPRLSVFQLREAQLAAVMYQESGEFIQDAAGDASCAPLNAGILTRAHLQAAATGVPPPVVQYGHSGSGSQLGSSGGLSVTGVSSQASHHEQFQAILQQLSRYQQQGLPQEYRPQDPRNNGAGLRGDRPGGVPPSLALRHHQGFDLGDIEEDDDFGAGGGMFYEEEEEEE